MMQGSSLTTEFSLPLTEREQVATPVPQLGVLAQNPQSLVYHQVTAGPSEVLEFQETLIENDSAQISRAIVESGSERSSHNLTSSHAFGIAGDGASQSLLENGSLTNPHASVKDVPFAASLDVAETLAPQPEMFAAIQGKTTPENRKYDVSADVGNHSDCTSKSKLEVFADVGSLLQDDARIEGEIEPSSCEQSGSSFPDVNSSTSDCSPSLSQDASLGSAELVSTKPVQLRNCWQRMRIPSAKKKRLAGRLHSPPAITESVMSDQEDLAIESDMTALHHDAIPLHRESEAESKRDAQIARMKDSSEQTGMGTSIVGLKGARSNDNTTWMHDDASLSLLDPTRLAMVANKSIEGECGDKSVEDIGPVEASHKAETSRDFNMASADVAQSCGTSCASVCTDANSEQSAASLCEMKQAEPMLKKVASAISTDSHLAKEVEDNSAQMLNLDVRTSSGAVARIRIRAGKPLKRLMQASREALAFGAGDELRFSANGRNVLPEDTAASIGLADGSVIEVDSPAKGTDDLANVLKDVQSQRCSRRKRVRPREIDAANNAGARNSGPGKRGRSDGDSYVANFSGSANVDASWERYRASRMAELRERLEERWNLLAKDDQVVDLLGMRYGWGTSETLTVATGGRISDELDQLIAERVRVVVQSGNVSDGAIEQTAAKHAECRDAALYDGQNDGAHELLSKLALDQARMPSPLLIFLESCCTSKSLSDSDASLALARWPEVSAVHRKALWSMVFYRASLQDKAIEAELRARGVEVRGSFSGVRNAFAEFVEKQRPQIDNAKGDMNMNAQSVIDAQRAFLQKSEAELSSYLSNEHWPWQLPSKADGFDLAGVL